MTNAIPVTAPAVTVFIGSKPHDVNPAKLGQLFDVLKIIEGSTIANDIGALIEKAGSEEGVQPSTLLTLLSRHGDQLLQGFAVLLKLPVQQLRDLDIDDAITLCSAAVHVNSDFFFQRLMPKLATLMPTSTTPNGDGNTAQESQLEPQAAAAG